MDATMITQTVSTLGFPIVACGVLAYLLYKEQMMHKEETKNFTNAINKLTIALTKLSDSIGGEKI